MHARSPLVALAILAAATVRAAPPTISWEEAGKHVGEEAVVEGRVLGVHCQPLSCLLAFEPTFNRFTAVVQARSFEALPPAELERRFTGRRVRVSGRIVELDGKPEIVVERAEALTLVDEEPVQREGGAAEPLRAQTEILERLGEVLARVEELTERLVATQERLETLLAQVEQREAALAAAQPAPAPPPSFGEPQPRPGYEALRSVKRGMTPAEIERLVGQPLYVESTNSGWTTWYYGSGRSVSFDARGRARSLVGFAQ
jgi:hypothetical protein